LITALVFCELFYHAVEPIFDLNFVSKLSGHSCAVELKGNDAPFAFGVAQGYPEQVYFFLIVKLGLFVTQIDVAKPALATLAGRPHVFAGAIALVKHN
jgi:hypothetical protein